MLLGTHPPLCGKRWGIGELSYHVGGRVHSCTAIGGFVEVLADRVIVLADSAERADEIDVARAQAARDRALKRLANPTDPNTDWKRAEEALERAQVRLQVAAKAGAHSILAGSTLHSKRSA